MSKPFTPIHAMTEAFRKAMCDIVAEAQEKQRQSTTQEQTPAPRKTKEGKCVHNKK
jgi:hypothetical protein